MPVGWIGDAARRARCQPPTVVAAPAGGSQPPTPGQGEIHGLARNIPSAAGGAPTEVFATQSRAGANCPAPPSPGTRFCFDHQNARAVPPLISGVAALEDAPSARGQRRIGLPGRALAMASRPYDQLERTDAVAPDARPRSSGRTCREIAAAGSCTPERRAILSGPVQQMIDDPGAAAIVPVGTDLDLAVNGTDSPGHPVSGAPQVHVARCAAGQMTREDAAT